MNLETRKALLTATLERAATALGDITPQVYARYYACHPDARACFEENYPGGVASLEGEMVSQVLYCLMEWLDSPGEIEIILLTTVPHHADTLHVSPHLFTGLITAVSETVAETIPAEALDERAVWADLHGVLVGVVAEGAIYARTAAKG
jgi:hypothetical protein